MNNKIIQTPERVICNIYHLGDKYDKLDIKSAESFLSVLYDIKLECRVKQYRHQGLTKGIFLHQLSMLLFSASLISIGVNIYNRNSALALSLSPFIWLSIKVFRASRKAMQNYVERNEGFLSFMRDELDGIVVSAKALNENVYIRPNFFELGHLLHELTHTLSHKGIIKNNADLYMATALETMVSRDLNGINATQVEIGYNTAYLFFRDVKDHQDIPSIINDAIIEISNANGRSDAEDIHGYDIGAVIGGTLRYLTDINADTKAILSFIKNISNGMAYTVALKKVKDTVDTTSPRFLSVKSMHVDEESLIQLASDDMFTIDVDTFAELAEIMSGAVRQ